jgi:S-adenosylmethionine:tRNA ribosyltransferase-isomerase
MFDIKDYDYHLPQELIAQVPTAIRDHSRLLVVDRKKDSFLNRHFYDLPTLLQPGDLLVVNDTKVVPARLYGRKDSGGRVEILVLESSDSRKNNHAERTCLMKSSKRPRAGTVLFFDQGVTGKISDVLNDGLVRIKFSGDQDLDTLIEERGHIPLPPYIKRAAGSNCSGIDKERYQTVFSDKRGAVAAPTAGLHFTWELVKRLEQAGVSLVRITLHVGYGTFRPVRTRDIRKHQLGEEIYHITEKTAETVNQVRRAGGRIVAVGTTVVRALETAVGAHGDVTPGKGKSNLLITPGFNFNIVDVLVTNFHLPKSSLLFLVAAFADLKLIRKAYDYAIENNYRFFSYGDAMLVF